MFRALSGDGQEIHLKCEGVGNDEIYLITYGLKIQGRHFPKDSARLVLAKGTVYSISFQPDDPYNLRNRAPEECQGMIYIGEAFVRGFDLLEKDEKSRFGYVTPNSFTKERFEALVKEDEDEGFRYAIKFSSKTAYFSREIAEIRLAELQNILDTHSRDEFWDATGGAITYTV